jgi:hypothetical protein
MAARIIKKITVRDVCGKPDILAIVAHHNKVTERAKAGERIDPVVWMLAILGICTDSKAGMHTNADGTQSQYVRFLGMFKGTNMQTGEEVRSGACILPGAIPDMLYGALKGQAGAAQIQFGFKIGVQFDDTSATKYIYVVESLAEVADNDPVLLLEQSIKMTGKMPALPEYHAPAPLIPTTGADPALPAAAGNLAGTALETQAEKENVRQVEQRAEVTQAAVVRQASARRR